MNTLKYALLAIGLTLLSSTQLYADWNPEECCLEKDVSVVQNQKYLRLKQQVMDYLKGSWCSQEKINLLMDLTLIEQPKVCVEIGTWTGSSALPIAATLKFLNRGNMFAIDAWSNTEATKNMSNDDPNKQWWSTVDMKSIFKSFQKTVKTWNIESCCTAIQQPSQNVANQFQEIDFLHLDGDYSEEGSVRDVELYLPKVKKGGYILLSNLFTMINGKQPKMKSFCMLFEECELVCEIEHDNAVLFRKN